MTRTKYKLGQMLQTEKHTGVVTELRLREHTSSYLLDGSVEVTEDEVTAVYRPVHPRVTKPLTTRSKKKTRETSSSVSAS